MSQSPSDSAAESAALLRQVQDGEARAAEVVFARYVERLTRLARSRLAPKLAARVDPEDIVQSAYRSFFIAARQGRFSVDRGGDLWRLLVEVTLHKLYRQTERHQARKRSVRREIATSDGSMWARIAGGEHTPEQAIIAAEELEAILAKLPARGREVIELRLQGYEQREIAARLGCTARTVRRWIEAAREMLARRGPIARRLTPGAGLPAAKSPNRKSRSGKATRLPRRRTAELDWNNYLLQQQIGAGSTGKVYRALERSTKREVAVKFLRKALVRERPVVERFLREARTVASLQHPGIVAVQGFGRTPGGGWFLVMELIRGRDLHVTRQAQSPTPKQAAAWVSQAAKIVQFAHQQGVIHCDLKPGNLLVDDSGAIRVTDFGLAVRLAEEAPAALLAGTPAFMAPEQVDPCWGPISPRTDVWGLGAVFYYLLFGQAPHIGRDVADTLAQVVSGRPVVFPANKGREIPAPLIGVCRNCLAKQPRERPESAGEVAQVLERTCESALRD